MIKKIKNALDKPVTWRGFLRLEFWFSVVSLVLSWAYYANTMRKLRGPKKKVNKENFFYSVLDDFCRNYVSSEERSEETE